MSHLKSILKKAHLSPGLENKKTKSYMEIENGRERNRWLSMAELTSIFGDQNFYSCENFSKLFSARVSDIN